MNGQRGTIAFGLVECAIVIIIGWFVFDYVSGDAWGTWLTWPVWGKALSICAVIALLAGGAVLQNSTEWPKNLD